MKFATIALIGAVAATNESSETLVAQKAELMQELSNIDTQLDAAADKAAADAKKAKEAAAAAAKKIADAAAALTPEGIKKAAEAAKKAAEAKSSNTGLIIGVSATVLVLAGVGFYVYKKKQGDAEGHEGGDDLFTKLVNEA